MATTTTPPGPPPQAPAPPGRPTVTPRLRLLWRIGGALLAAAMLAWGTVEVASLLAHEEEVVVSEFDASGLRALDVGAETDGDIRVVGAAGDQVRVTARISHGWRDTTTSSRVEGGTLVLRASCPLVLSSHCRVGYTIEVPPDTDLRLRGDSRIILRDLTGDVDASTANGRVEADRLAGDLVLRSDNGRVVGHDLTSGTVEASSDNGRVELAFHEPPDAVTGRSDNGDVEVVVPTGDDYRVDVASDNGSATASVDQVRASERTISATTDNGDVDVRYAG